MSQSITSVDNSALEQRIIELETQVAYLEQTIEQLNQSMTSISQEFILAKEAMQLMNRRLESLTAPSSSKDISADVPPPHY